MHTYAEILKRKKSNSKQFALLVDPDKISQKEILHVVREAEKANTDMFFVGSSLLINDRFENCIRTIKDHCDIPVVIFPGNNLQISTRADALLFLSLISGRNAEMLIGKHVISAPVLKNSGIEVISTGYMLVESGTPTAVSYMSNTTPIPHNKNDIALCTALAGEMLGMKMIFMDGGSGAKNPVSASMIRTVSEAISIPLIVGGGIRTAAKARENCKAGADVVVVGNVFEQNNKLIRSIAEAIHSC